MLGLISQAPPSAQPTPQPGSDADFVLSPPLPTTSNIESLTLTSVTPPSLGRRLWDSLCGWAAAAYNIAHRCIRAAVDLIPFTLEFKLKPTDDEIAEALREKEAQIAYQRALAEELAQKQHLFGFKQPGITQWKRPSVRQEDHPNHPDGGSARSAA